VLATAKADAQTRRPDQLIRPVLLPSTTTSIASKAWAWFFAITSIFLLFPVALVASLVSFFNLNVSEEFFAMLKVSPLGATVISGYFVLFFVTWGTSFFLKSGQGHVIDMPNAVSFLFPNVLPIHRIAGRFFQRFRYRRGHISHMRLDRLRRLISGHHIFTVFVAPPSGRTVAMRMYFYLTFIHNYLPHSQLFAMIPQLRTLSLPWHVAHSFRGHPNRCRTFI